ncbi:hypothetical protein ACFSB1_11265 [Halopseudomonas phragmitis]|uniref:hypothetical protein n=1 Tax=Halopseudomonas phragmitis TaxID=1931241 RepID=UPI001C482328|nr:hypothetical protein [Halopseudomonas phragmitis]
MNHDMYLSTFSGAKLSLIDPDPRSIHISDIAQGLAHQYRFNGHSHPTYTVAQHSVFVSHQVPAEHALQALLHDATEAYIGDLPAPAKALCPDYKTLEQRLHAAIMERFELPEALSPAVKHADLVALATEKRDLMPQCADDHWPMLDSIEPAPQQLGVSLPPDQARTQFLMRFRELMQPKSYPTGGIMPTSNSPKMATNEANSVEVAKNGAPQLSSLCRPTQQYYWRHLIGEPITDNVDPLTLAEERITKFRAHLTITSNPEALEVLTETDIKRAFERQKIERERAELQHIISAAANANEYCQANNIGQFGESAIQALIDDHKRLLGIKPGCPPQPPLARKHTGMRICAAGLLGRVGGRLKFGAQHMLQHLTEMATRYYSGDITAVDEFLQLYCLDDKRPSQPDQQQVQP